MRSVSEFRLCVALERNLINAIIYLSGFSKWQVDTLEFLEPVF